MSDAKVSRDKETVLVTHSLGSCIGVCLYDAAVRVGGMLHYQLPDSTKDPNKAKTMPFMYADSGLDILIAKLVSLGANKKRLSIKIAGGAAIKTGPKGFDIGKRNYSGLRKYLWKNSMFIDTADVGGSSPRNLYLNIANGEVTVIRDGMEKKL